MPSIILLQMSDISVVLCSSVLFSFVCSIFYRVSFLLYHYLIFFRIRFKHFDYNTYRFGTTISLLVGSVLIHIIVSVNLKEIHFLTFHTFKNMINFVTGRLKVSFLFVVLSVILAETGTALTQYLIHINNFCIELSSGELSIMKYSFGELSVQGIIQLGNCLSGNYPIGNCSGSEICLRRTFCWENVLQGKVCWVNACWGTFLESLIYLILIATATLLFHLNIICLYQGGFVIFILLCFVTQYQHSMILKKTLSGCCSLQKIQFRTFFSILVDRINKNQNCENYIIRNI